MIVKNLVFGKICEGFLVRRDTPLIECICRVSPDPFAALKQSSAAVICSRGTESSRVVCTPAKTNDIVNDSQVWKSDKLLN